MGVVRMVGQVVRSDQAGRDRVRSVARSAVAKWGSAAAVSRVIGSDIPFEIWLIDGFVRGSHTERFLWLEERVTG